MTFAPFTVPQALAPGDVVRVVAPSGAFAGADLWPGLAWLRARYRVRLSPDVLAREGYLAGADERRRDELAAALADPEAKAIVAARGGYGALRILSELPWAELGRRPRWIVGFSDVTALHAMAWTHAVASVHGPNVTGLGGAQASPATRASWLAALERPLQVRRWRGLGVARAGRARGVLVGGNLSIVHSMAAAGRLVVPPGAVVALEDVNEAPYRIDRMLTALVVGGHLGRASALVFGGLDRSSPGPDGWTAGDVVARLAGSLAIPVLTGAPFGHGSRNEAFVLGLHAEVDGGEVTLSCGAGEAGCSA